MKNLWDKFWPFILFLLLMPGVIRRTRESIVKEVKTTMVNREKDYTEDDLD